MDKLCLLVCKNYSCEINEVLLQENFSDVELIYYPQVCLKNKIPQDIIDDIKNKRDKNEDIVFLSDDCVLNKAINNNSLSTDKVPGSHEETLPRHCLQMFANRELIEYFSDNDTYLVTQGWLTYWRSILNQWGFTQKTAKLFFHDSLKQIALLETCENPKSLENLKEFAEYVELPYRIIPIGLDHFGLLVSKKILSWNLKQKDRVTDESINQMQQQLANYSLAFDMLSNLTQMMTEDDAIKEIKNIFSMLFAPKELTYIAINGGQFQKVYPQDTTEEHSGELLEWAINFPENYQFQEKHDGFILRIPYLSETLGVLEINNIAFPQYSQKYLNLGLVLAPLCGLTISNARAYQKIEENEIVLHQLASTDPLTGLFNRRHFFELAEVEFQRSKRYNRPLSGLMIDIDFFKKVNDTFSHLAGDLVLIELSRILNTELRILDIRCRMGGEEFFVLLPETDVKMAQSLAERIRKKVSELTVDFKGNNIQITISIGIASWDHTIKSLDDFIHCSDLALYQAKRNGRNQSAICEKNNASSRL